MSWHMWHMLVQPKLRLHNWRQEFSKQAIHRCVPACFLHRNCRRLLKCRSMMRDHSQASFTSLRQKCGCHSCLHRIKAISRDGIGLALTSWSAVVLHDGARVEAFDGFADLKVCLTDFPQDEYALNVLDVQCQSFADLELSRLGN